jgi:hypothetical protein
MSIRSAWQRAKMQYSQLASWQKTPIKLCATGIAVAIPISILSALDGDYGVTSAAAALSSAEVFVAHILWRPDTGARVRIAAFDRN